MQLGQLCFALHWLSCRHYLARAHEAGILIFQGADHSRHLTLACHLFIKLGSGQLGLVLFQLNGAASLRQPLALAPLQRLLVHLRSTKNIAPASLYEQACQPPCELALFWAFKLTVNLMASAAARVRR